MKTISLWQPYASLIAAGEKTIETRGWAPPKGVMGQRIAIHAAKAIETADVRGRARHHQIAAALNDPEWDENVPRGAVVCTAILDHAAQVHGPERHGHVTVAGNHLVAVDEWGGSARADGCGFSGTWNQWTRRSRSAAIRGSGIGSDEEETTGANSGGVSTADAVHGMPNAGSDEMAVLGQLSLPRLFS